MSKYKDVETVRKVRVKVEDGFASVENETFLVEMYQDKDSPACPNSWEWALFFDGMGIESTCDEMSFSDMVDDVIDTIGGFVGELSGLREYLMAHRNMF